MFAVRRSRQEPGPARASAQGVAEKLLGCLVAFGIRLEKPLFRAILCHDFPHAFTPAMKQAILRTPLFPEDIAVPNFSVDIEGELVRAKQGEVLRRERRLLGCDKDTSPSWCEGLCSLSKIVWSSREHFLQRILTEPGVYPSPHVVSGSLAAVLEMNLRFWDVWLRKFERCGIHAYIRVQTAAPQYCAFE
jgi:hypothetical protein